MSRATVLALCAAVLTGAGLLAAGCRKDEPTAADIQQKTCPVMGGLIDPAVHTDYQGDPDLGGKIRIVYECYGWNPAG